MDFIEKLDVPAKIIPRITASLRAEDATKNALIMQFLHSILGYDAFNPNEEILEFTEDTANSNGEKEGYTLVKNRDIQILIKCRKFGDELSIKHASLLFRYLNSMMNYLPQQHYKNKKGKPTLTISSLSF